VVAFFVPDLDPTSAHTGYNVSAAVNVPITDTLAMRASAFTRTDPGYIENIRSGECDVNRTEIEGAHLATLWRPSDVLSLNLSALAEDNRISGSPRRTSVPP
jgi:iron complex outermembrane recepter protein